MLEIVEVNDIEELSQYRMVWNAMFAGTPDATFFHTFDWLDTSWRHLGQHHKLRVLIVYSADEPIGILPLSVRRKSSGLGKVRVLTYPFDSKRTWYGPIGPNPAFTVLAALQHIRRTPRDWDMIQLRGVADDGTQGGKTARPLRAAGLFSAIEEYHQNTVIDISNNVAEFHAFKVQHLEHNSDGSWREMVHNQRVEFIRHRPLPASEGDGDPRWDLYSTCEAIAQANSRSNVVSGNTVDCERSSEYFRRAHEVAARLGMVDMALLMLDGQPAAFLYGYHYDRRVEVVRSGLHSASPTALGSVLLQQIIQDGCRRGDRSLHLGPGDPNYIGSRTEPTYRITYAPLDSWRSQTIRLARWAKSRLPRRVREQVIAS